MSKVHIALVGGQPTPVYQGAVLSQPDRIILICSAQTKDKACIIQGKLKDLKYFNVSVEVFPIEDVKAIINKLEILLSTISQEDTISMNLSSGVKIWALLCMQLCTQETAHIYCLSQNGMILNIRGISEQKQVAFDMFTQFILLGHPLENYTNFSDYGITEKQNHDYIEHLYHRKEFHSLLNRMQQEKQTMEKDKLDYLAEDRTVEIDDNHYIDWDVKDKVFAISLGCKGNDYFEVKGEHAPSMLLNTGWFEYEVATYLAEIYGVDNVYMNCVFKSEQSTSKFNDKNEVDVIVNTGQKLLFVECKTKITNITDIDKFASVVRNYGGDGSKSLFVTMFEMNEQQKEKCNDNKIANYYTHYTSKGKFGYSQENVITSSKMKQRILDFLYTAND